MKRSTLSIEIELMHCESNYTANARLSKSLCCDLELFIKVRAYHKKLGNKPQQREASRVIESIRKKLGYLWDKQIDLYNQIEGLKADLTNNQLTVIHFDEEAA